MWPASCNHDQHNSMSPAQQEPQRQHMKQTTFMIKENEIIENTTIKLKVGLETWADTQISKNCQRMLQTGQTSKAVN